MRRFVIDAAHVMPPSDCYAQDDALTSDSSKRQEGASAELAKNRGVRARAGRGVARDTQKSPVKRHNGLRWVSHDAGQTPKKKNSRKSGYRPPRKGESRKQSKPLRIDKLPSEVKDIICKARESGETWKRVAELGTKAAGVPLAPSTCQRWYDLRVEQARSAVPNALRDLQREQKTTNNLLRDLLRAVRS